MHTRGIFLELERLVGNKMTNYPVGDYLIRIKNAAMAKNRTVEVGCTKLIRSVAMTLKEMGYLEKVEEKDKTLTSTLLFSKREPILMNVKVVSRPGLRVYVSYDDLEKRRKPSSLIVSTSRGVMSSKNAQKNKVGGEVLAEIL